ncbi:MAG TPA: alpha/beta fold hydrolase [Vicinamibacterales bacterium]|nr:alpha/beta fold hydrolase [Vicinamibacterales bacterium]
MRILSTILVTVVLAVSAAADDGERILTIDHFVRVTSAVPALAGQPAQLYVRERVQAGMLARNARAADRVVLFVHGRGTPAEVAFDVPYEDYSWMAYLARAGFDVFSVDMTGYGRSTRPAAMNDPCNLSANQQAAFVGRLIAAPCTASYPHAMTTIASDWADIGAAVDYIRALRGVERVSLVAWSLGGPRAGGYAARNPQKVHRLVFLAPAYGRASAAEAPAKPAAGTVFDTQSRADFDANWDRQIGCPAQFDRAVSDVVWSSMLESDPVGATWGSGVRRAPNTTTWGWNAAVVARSQAPTLIVAGIHDKQVPPERPKELYEDLGAKQKVLIDLGCASHNAMWEKNHTVLFRASLEWLEKGTVNGSESGVLRLGY